MKNKQEMENFINIMNKLTKTRNFITFLKFKAFSDSRKFSGLKNFDPILNLSLDFDSDSQYSYNINEIQIDSDSNTNSEYIPNSIKNKSYVKKLSNDSRKDKNIDNYVNFLENLDKKSEKSINIPGVSLCYHHEDPENDNNSINQSYNESNFKFLSKGNKKNSKKDKMLKISKSKHLIQTELNKKRSKNSDSEKNIRKLKKKSRFNENKITKKSIFKNILNNDIPFSELSSSDDDSKQFFNFEIENSTKKDNLNNTDQKKRDSQIIKINSNKIQNQNFENYFSFKHQANDNLENIVKIKKFIFLLEIFQKKNIFKKIQKISNEKQKQKKKKITKKKKKFKKNF